MNTLYDPLQLPCGLVVPNRIMKAAMSEALADPRNSPDARPAVITPDAAAATLSGRVEVLPTRELQYGMRRLLGRFVHVKALDGVLNISWSTDQLHRMGAGLEPDLDRGRLATTVALLRRNGAGSFRPKRGVR